MIGKIIVMVFLSFFIVFPVHADEFFDNTESQAESLDAANNMYDYLTTNFSCASVTLPELRYLPVYEGCTVGYVIEYYGAYCDPVTSDIYYYYFPNSGQAMLEEDYVMMSAFTGCLFGFLIGFAIIHNS